MPDNFPDGTSVQIVTPKKWSGLTMHRCPLMLESEQLFTLKSGQSAVWSLENRGVARKETVLNSWLIV